MALKADLVRGLVPAYQLPSYVDDIVEFNNFTELSGYLGESSGKVTFNLFTHNISLNPSKEIYTGQVFTSAISTTAEIATINASKVFTDYLLVAYGTGRDGLPFELKSYP